MTPADDRRHWLLAIGISDYPFLPPLPAASRDAARLVSLWRSRGAEVDQGLWMSEHSPPVLGRPTYPNRENLIAWVRHFCRHRVRPNDTLWVFLAGYGISRQDQDYFVPIEGNPERISLIPVMSSRLVEMEQTSARRARDLGLPLQWVIEELSYAHKDIGASCLLLLDVQHPWVMRGQGFVGTAVRDAAIAATVPIIFASALGSLSQISLQAEGSIFATALVRALQNGCGNNLYALERALFGFMADLCQQAHLPIQRPSIIVNPTSQRYRPLFNDAPPETPTPFMLDRAPVSDPPPVADPSVDDSSVDNPSVEPSPVADPSVDDPPVADPPVADPPVADPPVADPSVDNPLVDDQPVDNLLVDAPLVDVPLVDDSPVDDSPVDDSPVDDSPVDDSSVDAPLVGDLSVGDLSVDDLSVDDLSVGDLSVDAPLVGDLSVDDLSVSPANVAPSVAPADDWDRHARAIAPTQSLSSPAPNPFALALADTQLDSRPNARLDSQPQAGQPQASQPQTAIEANQPQANQPQASDSLASNPLASQPQTAIQDDSSSTPDSPSAIAPVLPIQGQHSPKLAMFRSRPRSLRWPHRPVCLSFRRTVPAMTPNPPHSSQRASDSSFTSKLALGCGLAIVLLLVAVFVRNRDALLHGTPKPEPATPVAEMAPPAPVDPANVAAPAEADRLLVMAEDQIKRGQYDAAIAQLNRIPAERRNAQYEDLRGQAVRGRNRELLGEARLNFRSTQASDLSRAIRQVSQIQPQEPFYEEAQADIDRWSGMILDIAQGRAKRGEFAGAIAAAKLIPPDREASYNEAQAVIANWETLARQQQTNRDILQEAQRQVQAGQASSYNRAIDLASQIEAGQPGYAAARAQIDQWSQAILKLAEARANQNQLGSAIETALLVPPNTAAYPAAEQAISIWKRRLGG